MARILGVHLPVNKHLVISLRSIYGIGCTSSKLICEKSGINPQTKVKDMTESELQKVRDTIDILGFITEGYLRREVSVSIKRLMDIACYRGKRHRQNLPLRGQRTKTNARTRKGRKKPLKS